MEKWKTYEAYETVDDEGQEAITTRWIISEKEQQDGLKVDIKARLCLCGFQEKTIPQSDSPTAAKELLKVNLAIAANEKWKLESLDVTAAFLQGASIERDVYVVPPDEERREGELWKLKKGVYGLYDAARKWFLSVAENLENLELVHITGDHAVFYHREADKTQGVILIHVDDFLTMGTEKFYSKVINKLKKIYKFGKVETGEKGFRFTGIDIKVDEDGILMSQNEYASSILNI